VLNTIIETGLVPIYEAFLGQPLKVRKLAKRIPVTEYPQHQKRFHHLVEGQANQEHIALIQVIADETVAHYGL
jgi:pyruvate/2-oxoacid:ferredoxin oxidoreductase beta subunit